MPEKKYCPYCSAPLTRRELEDRMRLYCRGCQTIIYENPVPATCVVVANPEGEILLVKRAVDPKKGHWCLPGGYLELDEPPTGGALRELREETGLNGTLGRLLGAIQAHSDLYGYLLMVGYWIEVFDGRLVAGDDAQAARFFPLHSLPPVAFRSHRWFIDKARELKLIGRQASLQPKPTDRPQTDLA